MFGEKAGKHLELAIDDYVVIDLEATGVDTLSDMITEIAALKVISGKVVGEYSTLVNPKMEIPERVVELTGIRNEDVLTAPVIEEVLPEFDDFIGSLPLVGHSIQRFDMKMLYRMSYEHFGKTIINDYIDTLPYARHVLGRVRQLSLSALCEHYEISNEGAHRALNDCYMNQKVYEKLKLEPPSGKESRICPECGELLRKKSGRHGRLFYACATYPVCKYIEKI